MADLAVAAIAFFYEPREPKSLLWLVPVQRLFYRQLLYFIVFRAVFFALTGRVAGWRKLSRISTAVADTAVHTDAPLDGDLEWEGQNRRRWNRRAIDLRWDGPDQRESPVPGRRQGEAHHGQR